MRILLVLACSFLILAGASFYATAHTPGTVSFQRTWERTDKPVADRQISRTWIWGDQAFTGEFREQYVEAGGGSRFVQYFDKSRMEINHDPSIPEHSPWQVTNGLLVVELISGKMQVGDHSFESKYPAIINVAGDFDDATGPTYATFAKIRQAPSAANGSIITQRLNRVGQVVHDPGLAGHGVTAAHRVQVTGIDHQIASVFWSFMNSEGVVFENGSFSNALLFINPFYATGYPITEAYWANVKVAAVQVDVLVQCFERRCLTYTPTNADGWKVEAGNVGRHYHLWRHGSAGGGTPTPESSATATTSAVPSHPTATPTASSTPTPRPATATPTQIIEQLSYWYVNPDQAAYNAIEELCGCIASHDSPFVQMMLEQSSSLRHMYSLATAPIGQFNTNTAEYYEWQKEWIRRFGFEEAGDGSFFGDINRRIIDQVHIAIHDPESPIGVRIRSIEVGADPMFAVLGHTGPDVYWHFLLDPRFNPTAVTPLARQVAEIQFEQLVDNYRSDVAFGKWTGGFGSYLIENGGSLL